MSIVSMSFEQIDKDDDDDDDDDARDKLAHYLQKHLQIWLNTNHPKR